MQLHHAELLGLAEDAAPVRRRQLVLSREVVDRVRAVRAAQRAAIRELGDERVRARRRRRSGGGHRSSRSPLSRSIDTKAMTSCSTASRGAPSCSFASSSAMTATEREPSHFFAISAAASFELEPSLRVDDHVLVRVAIELEARLLRQSRHERGVDHDHRLVDLAERMGRRDRVEQRPEDLRLRDERVDAALLRLECRRVREHVVDRPRVSPAFARVTRPRKYASVSASTHG